MKILVVEDDSSSARVYADILEYWGHAVSSAGSVSEALALVAARPFDSALVDVVLPDGDGFSLVERMREVQPVLRCLIVSAVFDPEAQRKAQAIGADFRPKPLDFREIEELFTAGTR
ncbi:MAG: response regulator [Acidobacteria bacterium]|nr:MAG: response regulator [Acidobacteriota bacterium]